MNKPPKNNVEDLLVEIESESEKHNTEINLKEKIIF